MFSRHVSLSHRPMKRLGLCLSRKPYPHHTGVSPTITNHYCMFLQNRVEILLMLWAVLSVHQCKIRRIDFASGAGRPSRESRTDVKPCLGFSFQENARAWLSDSARLLIISTPEDHIRPSHSYIALFPVRVLDFVVYCIRGSGATTRAYCRCLTGNHWLGPTELPFF